MNVLLNEFFPDSVMQSENEFGYDDKEFEWCEIERAMRSMCSRKVPGMDGMNYLRKWSRESDWLALCKCCMSVYE